MIKILLLVLILVPTRGFSAEKQVAQRLVAGASRNLAAAHDAPAPEAGDEDDDDDDDEDDAPAAPTVKTNTGSAVKAGPVAKIAEDDADDDDDDDEDVADPTVVKGNVALASDYMLRGLTQTNHQAALQGGFDWEHPLGVYLGLWSSNVHFPDSASSIEVDGYGGYAYRFKNELTLSLGGLYYWYFDDATRNSWDIEATAEWRGFKLELDYSPRWQGLNAQAWYVNLGWTNKILWDIKPGAFVGYSFFPAAAGEPNYVDLKLSLAHEFLGLNWEAAGVFTQVQRVNVQETITDPDYQNLSTTRSFQQVYGGSRAVFTVSKSL